MEVTHHRPQTDRPPDLPSPNNNNYLSTGKADFDYNQVVQKCRETFNSGRTKPYLFRRSQLKQMKKMCEERGEAMAHALCLDLRKSKFESFVCEIDVLKNEIDNALMHLENWMAPARPKKSISTMMDGLYIYNDPRGVVLIMGAWNYPVQLTLMPLIGAIAAGNCVIIKPSEVSAHSSQLLSQLIPYYLDQDCYQVIVGGIVETTELLKCKFDYILYTGSTKVGQIVREAANRHLTPVTLELGGKSPVYLDSTANLPVAVKRILWGKCINSGQTCIAPDYLMCSLEVREKFLQLARKTLLEWYGENPSESPDLCKIINEDHYKRLVTFLDNGNIAIGGQTNQFNLFIAPTVTVNVNWSDPVMEEEIFGPILPIITMESAKDAITFINHKPAPLTIYVFSQDKSVHSLFLQNTTSGSVCINDTVSHFVVDTLPFGGVGNSGMGAYHGKYTFDTFTHKKSCMVKDYNPIAESFARKRYPPYTDNNMNTLRFLLKKRQGVNLKILRLLLLFFIGLIIGVAITYYIMGRKR